MSLGTRLRGFAGSLRGRLVLSAAAFVVAAVAVVGWLIAGLLHDTLRSEVESRLELQIAGIAAALATQGPALVEDGGPPEPDAPPGERRRRVPAHERPAGPESFRLADLDGPPYDRRETGWAWMVERGPERLAASRSLRDRPLGFDPAAGEEEAPGRPGRPRSLPAIDAAGRPVLYSTRLVELRRGPALRVTAVAPRAAIDDPARGAALTAAGTLALLGLLLLAAIALQVRFGLAPVKALTARLADIRAGEAARVPEEQPRELAPLAREINALIEHDAETLRQARLHVANLAHGLKTPLATLTAAIERQSAWPERDALLGQALLMSRRIGHHLRRARSAALDSPVGLRSEVEPAARDLVFALEKMGAGRPVAASLEVEPGLAVMAGEEDLSEMLGNLLDNAWRHAGAQVRLSARREGALARIAIEDDGPGLQPGDIEAVLQPGRRLDERTPGFGFGLPITAELAELNGGRLALGRSAALGGLEAALELAAARPRRA